MNNSFAAFELQHHTQARLVCASLSFWKYLECARLGSFARFGFVVLIPSLCPCISENVCTRIEVWILANEVSPTTRGIIIATHLCTCVICPTYAGPWGRVRASVHLSWLKKKQHILRIWTKPTWLLTYIFETPQPNYRFIVSFCKLKIGQWHVNNMNEAWLKRFL